MENYTRIRQPRPEEEHDENEVRITSAGKARNYITYAHSLLTEKEHKTIILRAMGKAINKTVAIAEIIKRRVEGLHQSTVISSTNITDIWEPKQEGLDRIETTRHVSVVTITLSKEPLDTDAAGYQAPLAGDEFKPVENEAAVAGETEEGNGRPRRSGNRRGRGRGRGRGGRGGANAAADGDGAAAAAAEGGDGDEGGEGAKKGRRRGRGRGKKNAVGGDGSGEAAAEAAPAEE